MKRVLALAVLLLLALAAAACGVGTVTRSTDSLAQSAQASSGETRGVTGTMLRDGTEIPVYLAVSDTEIAFWDSPSGGEVLAVARYPEPMPGAAAALTDCDHQDLDGDGCSDFGAAFTFPDGSTANLLWLSVDGEFVYQEEFSQLPGDLPPSGEDPEN